MNTFSSTSEARARENRQELGFEDNHKSLRTRNAMLLAGGVAAAAYGVWRRDSAGHALVIGGAVLASRAAVQGIPVRTSYVISQTINRPAADIYGFWRNFHNWPLFMKDVKRVQESGPRAITWRTGTAGQENDEHGEQGQSEIVEDTPDKYLRWRSVILNGKHEASAEFRPAPGNRGTEVRLSIVWTGAQSMLKQLVKGATGNSVEQHARESLRALKQLLEAGEVATTDGQARGYRGFKGKTERAMFRESVDENKRPVRATELPNQQLAAS